MESGDEIGSKDKSDTKGEKEEDNQANRDRVWSGTREKARQHEPQDNIQAKNVTKAGEEGRGRIDGTRSTRTGTGTAPRPRA